RAKLAATKPAEDESRFLSGQADPSLGSEGGRKKSGCSARNDSVEGRRRAEESKPPPLETKGGAPHNPGRQKQQIPRSARDDIGARGDERREGRSANSRAPLSFTS